MHRLVLLALLVHLPALAQTPPTPGGLVPSTGLYPRSTRTVTLAWNAVSGTDVRYAVRASDDTQPSLRDPRNNCPGDQHYLCVNALTTTSISLPVTPGHQYRWWVHAVRDGLWSAAAIATFTVSATSDYGFELTGNSQVVAASNTRCGGYDIPDGSAAAFRNSAGEVNLVSPSEINWRSVGTTLNNVQKNCTPIFSSAWDQTYANFRNSEWLTSFYTEDGNTVYGLVHNEWYAYFVDGRCPAGPDRALGWVNAVTTAVSNDGGRTFAHPADYVVSRPPVGWQVGDPRYRCDSAQRTVFGSFGPSNIFKLGSYYHAAYQSEADPPGLLQHGTCLMRTRTPAAGSSWEKWTANGWDARPDAVCSPIEPAKIGTSHNSLTFNRTLKRWILVGNYHLPTPGMYFSVSDDLFHWSERVKIFPLTGRDYVYPAILDPTDTTRNFERPGDRPYLYWTNLDSGANMRRQQIRFIDGGAPRVLAVPAGATVARSANWRGGQEVHNWYGLEWLEYAMEVPAAGAWKIGLWARNAAGVFPPPSPYHFLVDVHVNATYVGRIAVPPDRAVYQHAFLTTNLPAGVNRIRYTWINDEYAEGFYDSNIEIREVTVAQ
jgi:hypothetical protein